MEVIHPAMGQKANQKIIELYEIPSSVILNDSMKWTVGA